MATKKINELNTESINLTDLFVKSNASGQASNNNIQGLNDLIVLTNIVNDLTTGGTDKFASAETVKTLNENKVEKSTVFTGTVIPLDKSKMSYQTDTAKNFTSYTLSAIKILGASAKIWINTTTEPTITGATKVGVIDWETGKDFDLFIEAEQLDLLGGIRVVYFYAER